MKNFQMAGLALLLATATLESNAAIERTYYDPDGSGVVTFDQTEANQLTISFDNTTGNTLSSIITGLVFDIDQDINGASVASFIDSTATDLTSYWLLELDVSNNITPGNTEVDVSFKTTGITGGIFNNDNVGNTDLNHDNAFPDIATLVLNISSPTNWSLNSISGDILRMQRTGLDGDGSLKIPGVPIPAAAWLFGSGLIGLAGIARKRKAS